MMHGAVFSSLLVALLTVGVVRGGIPPGADTTLARCFTTPSCTLGTEVSDDITTAAVCCLSERGLAYNIPGTEQCVQCILYGWLSGDGSTVRVEEDGPGQSFQVGYIKPGTGPPTIELTVEDTEGTATRGTDYTVTDNDLMITGNMNDSAVITIRVDGVALEADETFQLRLVASEPPAGVFCMDTLTVIISDVNVVNIQLTEDDYRGNERDESIGITVSKDARIATNVSLTVSPVVLSEARSLNLFPMNAVPPDDNGGRSPVEANLDDFDNTVLTLTFLADEDTPRNEMQLRVPIADDAINEANEQDFVVILNLTNSVNPDLTMLTRRSSLCRIIDNDPIIIGFERSRNNFTEPPMFDEEQTIYLTKQDNVVSEQLFRVSFQRTNAVPQGSGFAIAEDGVDYSGILEEFDRDFAPNLQRLSLSVTLLPDRIPEATEAFQIGSSPQGMPTFNSPDGLTLFTQTFVVIEDDDIIVRIGFEETSFTVNEETGVQEVCVRVFEPDETGTLGADIMIHAAIATRVGTADETDYTPLNPELSNVVLVFNNATRRECFQVVITNDVLVEGPEEFSLELLGDPFMPPPSGTTVFNASLATVTILDQDEAVIGFLNTNYSASESSERVTLMFGLLSGGVQSSVDVLLELSAGTALDGADFNSTGDVFTFNASTATPYSFDVPLVNDDVYELIENFTAQLSFVGAADERVTIDPGEAQVEILDDDVVTFGFSPASYSVDESVGTVSLGVSFLEGSFGSAPISVQLFLETISGTAQGTPAAEADYQSLTQQSTPEFSQSTRTRVVPVVIFDDDLTEDNETFGASLSNPVVLVNGVEQTLAVSEASRIRLQPDTASVEITDNDVSVIGFLQAEYSGFENQGAINFTVGVISGELRIDAPFTFSTSDIADPNNRAEADRDYTSVPGLELVFNNVVTSLTVPVSVIDDGLFELTESFNGLLTSTALPSNVRLDPDIATGVILEEGAIVIGWEQLVYTTSESSGSVELCATITSQAEVQLSPFNLTVQYINLTADEDADYSVPPVSLSIGPFSQASRRACVNVNILEDSVAENLESLSAMLMSSSNSPDRLTINPDTTRVDIQDNDVIELTLDPTPNVTVAETDGSVQICVKISNPPNSTAIQREEFFISISTMDGTATDPSDYTGVDNMNFGPFSNTMRRQCISIPIMLDTVPETDEQFAVTASENVNGVVITSPTTTVTIVDSIRQVNDSVIGDPLMTVPINLLDSSAIPKLGENAVLNLCYELHGDADATFNLVSDGCVSVNSHYVQVRPTESQNIIDAIYVRAVDNGGTCHNIAVSLTGCSASVDGVSISSMYSSMGVSVRPYSNRVRIAVPNCAELDLVMWVICQTRTLWSSQVGPGGQEITFTAEMIKFVIARGLNLQETSHGLLGQFWNIPVDVSAFDISNPNQELYTVTVHYPGREARSFVGMLWPLTWEYREEYCLYTGNGQAGPLDVADTNGGPNDPVIEGEYLRYKVDSDFATDFEFAHFNETRCV